jgi:hypothetical protein
VNHLRDALLNAADELDPTQAPPGFANAQRSIRKALARMEGVPGATLAAVLLSEGVPRLADAYGPQQAAQVLAMLADCLSQNAVPPSARQ